MSDNTVTPNDQIDEGALKVQVVARGSNVPIQNATITISYSGDPESSVEEVTTDDSGMSEQIALAAPPLEYSMEPGENQPFSQYTVSVTAEGFRTVNVSGIEVF